MHVTRQAFIKCAILASVLLLNAVLLVRDQAVFAQQDEVRRPIDMMLVIDNSCSMFPRDQILPECGAWGSDPDFLRITGAELFLARLGFAEINEEEYQLAAISMGEAPPQLQFPLTPVAQARDELARALHNPLPQAATQIIPALEMAYAELTTSPRRKPGNQPAIVLLTDGRPYPEEGQTASDLERFVTAHPDIPLFIILLRNAKRPDPDYERYIEFWERLGRDYEFIQAYRVEDATEISQTYHDILARLQNSSPSPGYQLNPGEILDIFVNKYVQRLVITIIHEREKPKGKIEIKDPLDKLIAFDEPGVKRFRGKENQIEVISIDAARLDQAPRDDIWTITSEAPVSVFLDYVGAYNIEIVSPEVSYTSVPNQYLAIDRISLSQPFAIRFRLVDKAGNVVTEPQILSGMVLNPDGSSAELRIPQDITPDENGIYTIEHDFLSTYPPVADKPGRFLLSLQAGEANTEGETRIPIARADLLVDVGRGAYIANVAPQPFICKEGESSIITVIGGDLDAAQAGSVHVRVLGAGAQVELAPGGGDAFVGPLTELCQALLQNLTCDMTSQTSFRVRMVAGLPDGSASPPSEARLPVEVIAAACTPTPTPTSTPTPLPTATPTPTPTPIPNTDGDRLNNLEDRCIEQAEWSWAPYFQGCPPPWWLIILGIVLILALMVFVVWWLIPYLWVSFISKPPGGYVLICQDGKPQGSVRSIADIGRQARRSKITIGSKGHLRIRGLQDKEFIIEKRGKEVVVLNAKTNAQRAILRPIPITISTSNQDVKLIFGSDREKIDKMRC